MNFHSRLVGALDALLLTSAALLMIALLLALMNPLQTSGRAATLASQSLPVVADYAAAQSLVLNTAEPCYTSGGERAHPVA